jgi:hypothetical protein
MNSNRKFAEFGVCLLSVILLFTACDSKSEKLSVKEAETIIQELLGQQKVSLVSELNEITPPEVWSETKHQIFKDSSSLETFVVAEGKAAVAGNGFGGAGVTSMVPYDVNNDGTTDLVYAYSFGSGIHRSVISWMDLNTMTEYSPQGKIEQPVRDSIQASFRTYDLILDKGKNKIVVYQIVNKQNKEDVYKALQKYPSKKDIQSMDLKQEGLLYVENDVLFYEAVDVK